jgi:hypothetical protein
MDASVQATDISLGPYNIAACPTHIPNPMATLKGVKELPFWHLEDTGLRVLALGKRLECCQSLSCILNPLPYPADGGDVRCLSQLVMLEELMRRLEYDHREPVRPCQFFHSITGVGASGWVKYVLSTCNSPLNSVIAILLGALGMTAAGASNAFTSMCIKIFAEDVSNEAARSEILRSEIEGILAELNIPLDTRLMGNIDHSTGCRVYVGIACSPFRFTDTT